MLLITNAQTWRFGQLKGLHDFEREQLFIQSFALFKPF